uniref:MUN domain-containing protein n=1 Tax=Lepeophtheirus salmonis TaxID=72036 RepID=A0A0K2T649_LEPSM
MKVGLVSKLVSVLESVLSKLGRYDEGSVIGSILSFTNKHNVTGTGSDLGKQYMSFIRANMDQIAKKISDDLWVLNVMERWHGEQVQMLCTWLTDRLDRSLHPYQCTCLAHIVKTIRGESEAIGVCKNNLKTRLYQSVVERLTTEYHQLAKKGKIELANPLHYGGPQNTNSSTSSGSTTITTVSTPVHQ